MRVWEGWAAATRYARGLITRTREPEAEACDLALPVAPHSLFACLFTEVLDGRNAATADGVQRALGRAPRDARTWASGSTGLVTTA